MPDIIAGKLDPPYFGADLIKRPRLSGLFGQDGRQKATVLIAPAGYGKTVLALQLAQNSKKPLVWYQLDEYDNDPAVFLQYLISGIQRYYPNFGKHALPVIARGDVASRLRQLLTIIVNGLAEKEESGAVIVLDDYYVISENMIHSLVQSFIKHAPTGIHIVITSRITLPWSLSRSTIQGEVCLVNAEELRFNRQEIGEYWKLKGKKVSDEIIESLENKTAGWPAALQLIQAKSAKSNNEFNTGRQKIFDYLATEVFDQEPEKVRNFLLATSILKVITPLLCDRLLMRTDSQQILDYLYRQGLFLIQLTGGEAYSYHQLFREFLQKRLGEERHDLLRKAGLLAWELGEPENAVEYMIESGCHQELISMIREAGKLSLSRGKWLTVARWLESLPEDLSNDSWLGLYRAKVELYRGRLDEAKAWLDRALSLFTDSQEQAGLIECGLLRARLLRCRGHYTESLELLDGILVRMPKPENNFYYNLVLEKALCLVVGGRPREAETVLKAALAEVKHSGDNFIMAHLLEGVGTVYYIQGDYPKALKVYKQGAEMLPDHILPSYYAQDSIATIYQDWGESERAFQYAKRNVAIKEVFVLAEALPSAYIQLAGIYVDRGEWSLAEEYFSRAIKMIRDNNGEVFFLALNLIFFAECIGLQGRWLEARVKAEEAMSVARQQMGLSLAVCQAVGAIIFVQTGDMQDGKRMLSEAVSALELIGFKKGLCYAYAFQAWLYINLGEKTAVEYAGKSLALAARLNTLQLFVTRYGILRPVLAIGLEIGIETNFVHRVLVLVGTDALPLLVDLSQHVKPDVRRRTLPPLAEIGGLEAQQTILRMADDPDTEVRQLARAVAQRLGIREFAPTTAAAPVMPLRVATLGMFRVYLHGDEVDRSSWRTTKTRDLLAYLVHHATPVNKDKIIEDLWPETDFDKASIIFRTTLYNLRKTLRKAGCQDLIFYGGKHYGIQPDSFSSDYKRFEELVANGMHPETEPDAAVTLLERAVVLYQGDYLADMDYFWVMHFQERLRNLCLGARMQLARHYLKEEDYNKAISQLQIVEETDPFAEEVHCLLMTAYSVQGNRLAVQRQFRKLDNLLQNELGLVPSQNVRDLYLRLMK